MHSSRMRTVRNSSCLLEAVPAPGEWGPAPGVMPAPGGTAPGDGSDIPSCTEADPPVDRQTGVKT